jgi:hypothetical protein
MPHWALFDLSTREILIRNRSGNPKFREFELDIENEEHIKWLILILYLNRNSKAEQKEFMMLMSDDFVTDRSLFTRILSDSTIRPQRYLRLYHKKLIRSNRSLLVEILNEERHVSMKVGGAGSERESHAINNVDIFKYLLY